MTVLHVLLAVLVPACCIWAADRFKPAKVVGPVVLAYAVGIIFGNLPGIHVDEKLGQSIAGGAVFLAVPLLLFSTDLKSWLKLARSLSISFGLACVAAIASASAVGWAFRNSTDEWWKIAGMLVGVYVGGTANMSAVGLALETREETFVVLNTADLICGGAYLFFLLSVAQRLLLKVLPAFKAATESATADDTASTGWRRANTVPMAKAFGLALVLAAVGVGVSLATTSKMDPGVIMLVITTLSIAASLVPAVRALTGSYDLGEYALLIFCVAMGSMADVSKINGTSFTLFAFVAIMLVAAAALHFALCALFRIDADTAIICSTAAIFGPPFIGAVAASLKNRTLVGPGLTLGLAGIALGTYLGLATAWALKALAGV